MEPRLESCSESQILSHSSHREAKPPGGFRKQKHQRENKVQKVKCPLLEIHTGKPVCLFSVIYFAGEGDF